MEKGQDGECDVVGQDSLVSPTDWRLNAVASLWKVTWQAAATLMSWHLWCGLCVAQVCICSKVTLISHKGLINEVVYLCTCNILFVSVAGISHTLVGPAQACSFSHNVAAYLRQWCNIDCFHTCCRSTTTHTSQISPSCSTAPSVTTPPTTEPTCTSMCRTCMFSAPRTSNACCATRCSQRRTTCDDTWRSTLRSATSSVRSVRRRLSHSAPCGATWWAMRWPDPTSAI